MQGHDRAEPPERQAKARFDDMEVYRQSPTTHKLATTSKPTSSRACDQAPSRRGTRTVSEACRLAEEYGIYDLRITLRASTSKLVSCDRGEILVRSIHAGRIHGQMDVVRRVPPNRKTMIAYTGRLEESMRTRTISHTDVVGNSQTAVQV